MLAIAEQRRSIFYRDKKEHVLPLSPIVEKRSENYELLFLRTSPFSVAMAPLRMRIEQSTLCMMILTFSQCLKVAELFWKSRNLKNSLSFSVLLIYFIANKTFEVKKLVDLAPSMDFSLKFRKVRIS